MRIGLSANFIDPALTQGQFDGIGIFTRELHQRLLEQQTSVLPVIFPPSKDAKISLAPSYQMKQSYPLAAAYGSFIGPMLGGKQLDEKIDLYHCTDYLVPRLKNTPVLATIHDAVKVKYPRWNSHRLRALKIYALKKAVHWADHYIAPSNAVIPELVEHFGLDERKISVVHNAISEQWLTPLDEMTVQACLAKFQLRPGFLLFTGTFQPRKNIGRLLKVAKSLDPALLKDHPLVLVGKRGWIEEEVIDEIKALSAKGLVRWLNYVDDQDLRALYQAAAMFLFPSLHEGFGLPILEAFASKTPVITSNCYAMPEVAGEAAYLIDPYQEEALREAILDLLSNPSKRQTLIEKGQERLHHFSWKRCLDETLTTYRILL